MTLGSASAPRPLRAAVLASGGGSNFQALVQHSGQPEEGSRCWHATLLISDRDQAGALERARRAGIPSRVIPVAGRAPEEVARETLEVLGEAEIDFLLLAGYLRLVPSELVRSFQGRILNVHPALLPAFGGKGMYGRRIHEAVLESGVRVTGVTVHLVDEVYDRGRILAQWPVPVFPADDPESLGARVLEVEHALYPRMAEHLARSIQGGREVAPLAPRGDVFLPAGVSPQDPRASVDLLKQALDRVLDPRNDPSLSKPQDHDTEPTRAP